MTAEELLENWRSYCKSHKCSMKDCALKRECRVFHPSAWMTNNIQEIIDTVKGVNDDKREAK